MKTLFTLVAILCITTSSLKAQYTGQMDVGYSTQSINLKPVFAFTLGHVFKADEYRLAPLIETGFRTHTDQQSANNIYGHVSAGLQLDHWLTATAGIIYGGNQQKQDRHVTDDTVIVLTPGAASANYLSYQIVLRGTQTLMKRDDGLPFLQVVEQITYAHNVWYGSVGVRWSLFD